MTMQEETRYERAARALHAMGERVSHVRMDRWLREHDGRGCSPRDSTPVIRRYREATAPAIAEALDAIERVLSTLTEWERREVLTAVRRRYRGPHE